jgi:hypothetical protein
MHVTQNEGGTQLAARALLVNGEGGIRTRGELSPTRHFQCRTFGRSVTSPVVQNPYFLNVYVMLVLRTSPPNPVCIPGGGKVGLRTPLS